MAKCRIGHTQEARLLEALGVDFIDESEVLTPADDEHHVDKSAFRAPFVCGARDLGEALRRIGEGAAMIRTKGEAGSGNIVEAVRHLRRMGREMRALAQAPRDELMARAKEYGAPYELVLRVAELGALPVPNFAAGGIATPADAALCMSLGAEAVFVGSGIFKSADPGGARARDRARDHALAGAEGGARGVARPRRRDARARARGDPRGRAAGEARLVKVGVLALQGDFAAHARALAGVGAEPLLVRASARPRAGSTRWSCPAASRPRCCTASRATGSSPRCARSSRRAAPVLGTCAGAILLAREVRGSAQRLARRARHRGRAQRLRHAARLVRVYGRDRRSRAPSSRASSAC